MLNLKQEKQKKKELKQKNELIFFEDKKESKASEFFYSRMDNIEYPKKLTIEQVRSNKKFANITDQDAKELIDGLYKLSIITYNIFNYGTGQL